MNHPTDEKLYLLVAHELSVNKHEEALWTMAFALENGDEAKTKAHYIRLRVAQLRGGLETVQTLQPVVGVTTKPQSSPPLQPYIRVDMPRATAADQPDLLNEYRAVVGEKNLDYYLARFAKFDDQESGMKASWNWAAFFFSGFWALYRKMYGWFFFFLVFFTMTIPIDLALERASEKSSSGVGVAIASLTLLLPQILFGIFANSLYWKKCQSKIQQARSTTRDEQRALMNMQQNGGVLGWLPKVAITLAVVIPVLGIAMSIVLPKIQSKKDDAAAAQGGLFDHIKDVPPPVSSTPKTPYDPDKYAFLDHEADHEASTLKTMAKHGLTANATVADVDNWVHNEISRWGLNDKDRAFALLAATRWSKQSLLADLPPAAAYFRGFFFVKSFYEGQHKICTPSTEYGADAVYSREGGEYRVHAACQKSPH